MNLIKRLIAAIPRRSRAAPKRPPWYTGAPTFPADNPYIATSIHQTAAEAPSSSADFAEITQVPSPCEPAPPPDEAALQDDTHPTRRSVFDSDPLEDTRPTQAVHPTARLEPGSYDHLFPPAQPGDDDYLEADPSQQTPPPDNLPR